MPNKNIASTEKIRDLEKFPVEVLEAALIMLRMRDKDKLKELDRLKSLPNEMLAKHLNSLCHQSEDGDRTRWDTGTARATSSRGFGIYPSRSKTEGTK